MLFDYFRSLEGHRLSKLLSTVAPEQQQMVSLVFSVFFFLSLVFCLIAY